MATVTQKDLMPGVSLTAVHTSKFKTFTLGVTLLTQLSDKTAALNALIPQVLRRGNSRYPNMEKLSAALDDLYGGVINPAVRKKGETQCVGFVGSFLDDVYTLDKTAVLEPAAALMGELLLSPVTEQGCFREDYVVGERANLVDKILAQMNEKRQYSVLRLGRIMCEDEAYGVDRLGDEKSASAITPQSLWAQYQTLLKTAKVQIYYCGSASPERVEQVLRRALEGLPQTAKRTAPDCEVRIAPTSDRPKTVEEAMDVTQGKLALGFRTGGACMGSDDYPALLLLNAVYGGTTTSKLFMNVREKLSLCYFASSLLEKQKGVMMVSSGIEFEKYEQAKSEILAQLDTCRKGEIESGELEGARRSVVSSLQSSLDAQGRLEEYWLEQAAAVGNEAPEALVTRVEQVTLAEVVALANKVKLDTVYFLKGGNG